MQTLVLHNHTSPAPPGWCHLGFFQPRRHLALEVVAIGREIGGQLQPPDGRRRLVEVECCQHQEVATSCDGGQPHPTLAMGVGEHGGAARVAPFLYEHDVARPQLHQRQRDRVVAHDHARSLYVVRCLQAPVLIDVAEGAAGLVQEVDEVFLSALQAGLDLHHVAVGLVLRERQVQQVVRPLAGV